MTLQSSTPVFVRQFLFVAVAIFVTLGMSINRLAGVCFYLLVLLGLIAIFVRGRESIAAYLNSWRSYWPVYLAMSAFTLCILLSQAIVSNGTLKDVNFGFRFMAFIILFWAFLQLEARHFRLLGFLFGVGALVATVKTYLMTNGGLTREHDNFMPILAYTELAMMLGALAVLSIKWDDAISSGRIRLLSMIFKLTAGIGGLYSIYLYQSRGAWLAIPIFVVTSCLAFMPRGRLLRKMAVALAILLVIGGIYGSTSTVRERFVQAGTDINGIRQNSNMDSSLGTRYQLWSASVAIFEEHPLVGVGINGYSNALEGMADRGLITKESAKFPHSHNELLFIAVLFGSVGIVSLLALYFVPLWYFLRESGLHNTPQAEAAMLMGVTLCLSYVANGLVDVMFVWRECALFYTIMAALLMAAVKHFREPGAAYPR
ncbi:O-antigen ligase family protein [Herbaspirillum chlorophenolicum]|uniref:O-antigen ligase family protein n=1 Tax=Herbaspirillum chlorophenolicum TaxID=211589 RepID=A0ABW8F0U2_9BURK